ncbi:MAG: GNAT family N-acetyltransferase [Mesorhizobium sp.]
MAGIPTIETERLILRGVEAGDFDTHAAMWADPEVTRFIGGRAFTREESWARFLRHVGMWQLLGFGSWVVTDKASGERLGAAGFHDLKRELEPSFEGTLEAGWAFVPQAHGRGIATEAMAAALGWAEANLPDMRVTCLIAPQNLASLRVAEKLGFKEFARTDYHGSEVVLMERVK